LQPKAGVKQTGHNYILYDRFEDGGMRMRPGFPVSAPFDDTESVACVTLPAGKAAHTVHVGPYSGLGEAYSRLNAWCEQQGLSRAPLQWELYGNWNDDESKLVTDLKHQIELRLGPTSNLSQIPSPLHADVYHGNFF
jgi:effector-binding domain-containing protein